MTGKCHSERDSRVLNFLSNLKLRDSGNKSGMTGKCHPEPDSESKLFK